MSLLGLITLQVNWINNLVDIREVELNQKINSATANVANELSTSMFENGFLKFKKRMNDFRLDNTNINFFTPPSIGQKFTQAEIEHKLHKALEHESLGNIIFEFAVINGNTEYEMMTPKFIQSVSDTLNNKAYPAAIVPESGTDFENLTQLEHIVVVVPKFNKQIWSNITPMLIASFLFTSIIIAAFYLTHLTFFLIKR